ncbi:MAG: HEAT repeat domain-containing protein [Planctomycetota bacterium]
MRTRCGPDPRTIMLCLLAAAGLVPADEAEKKLPTDPKVIAQKVAEIAEEYEAIARNQDLRQTRRRRELARRLGDLSHEESVKILLRIIENDADLRAQIVAMKSLCRVGDVKAVQRMYRHVKREAQRSVLPDYLGPTLRHATDPKVGPWIVAKVLPSSNRFLRLSAVEAAGVLRVQEARAPLLKMLEKKAGKNMHLRFEIIRALGQIGGAGVWPLLERCARDREWRIRLAAAEVMLIHHRDDKAIALMRDLLKDKQAIVREVAAIEAGEHKMEPLFKELVLLLREGNLRAKQKSYEAMKAISGQDFGYAPDVWAKWLRDRKKGKLTQTGALQDRERISVGTYYRFKIFSDRVLFVIDVSGSMQWPNSEPNRIQVARRELVKAIKSLNEKTLFNMATFAGHVNMWNSDGEVSATEENKKKALAWIARALLPRGATNTYDALIEGLMKNPQVDTVYFLSDGIPSTGRYEVPEEILIKLRYANRFRKVIFHTIAIVIGKPAIEKAEKYEDPDEMAAFMRMIAEWNGGTCLEIRKPYLDLRGDD